MISSWRWKFLAYVGLVGIGLFAMPGPTLLLMLLLILPYLLFLDTRRSGRLNVGRFALVMLGGNRLPLRFCGGGPNIVSASP